MKILLVAVNAKYIHSCPAIYSLKAYADEYKKLLVRIIDSPDFPILCNINIGHATPRCIIPFGVNATVDADRQVIKFE